MIDRSQYGDTRKELQQLQRLVYLLTQGVEKLTKARLETRLESRRQNQGTRAVVYRAAANFWERPGLTEIPRNTFGIP